MQQRLIELNVMKDPDVESVGSASDSTEFEDDFDFVKLGRDRVGHLFKGKKAKSDKDEKSVAEQMRRNDLKVMNRMLEKAIEHEEKLIRNREEIDQLTVQLAENTASKDNLEVSMIEMEARVNKEVKDLNARVTTTDT